MCVCSRSAAQVAESAALATNFQLRLFTEDMWLAIDSKTSFLDQVTAPDLVTQVRDYRGPKLWLYVMNQVRVIQKAQAVGQGWWRKEPSPFALRMGYEQNLDALHTNAIS